MTETSEVAAKVYDILKGFSTAMFVTVRSGELVAHPMHVAKVEEDSGSVWFFTVKSGMIIEDVAREADVLLAFQNENSAYLSLRGSARIVENRQRIQELWKEPYKVWFPGGIDDPEIALISVQPVGAEYWDNRGMNKLEYLFESAKAYLKGEKPTVADADQHAKTKL